MAYKRTEIAPEQIAGQLTVCERLRAHFQAAGKTPLALVDTYGCQQNEADSEKLRGYLAAMGFGFTQDENEADLVIFNTCAVREHAEQRVFGNVGALNHTKAKNPDQIIAVCGCMVQQPHMAEKLKKSYRIVDLVFGPHELWRFPELFETVAKDRHRVFEITPKDGSVAEGIPLRRDGSVKAWLSIMYGCNNFCTYCIVPYVRGRERSREPDAVIGEVRDLVARGYRDITLLGQNVNSYGRGCSFECDFTGLLRRADGIDGDFLLRFMTSHPKDATPELIDAMAGGRHVARQFHLPAQSGSDAVLRAMNRGYTREKYMDTLRLIKERIPGCVVSTDIIVGFPGETEADFEDTLSLLREAGFDMVFSFIYSPRAGTPAATFGGAVDPATAGERMQRLLELQTGISAEKNAAYKGREIRVLTCGRSRTCPSVTECRTEGGKLLHIRETVPEGIFVKVKVTGTGAFVLEGELAEKI